jgi:Ca2+-binding RTX toxin-like protein
MRRTIGLAAASACLLSTAAVAFGAGPSGDFDRPDVIGTEAADTLQGSIGSERIFALGGNDIVNAGPGSDWADGGQGADTIDGASGNDLITGETCNAERCDPPESDTLRGGSGDDRIESNRCRTDVYPEECPDGSASDKLYGQDGNDVLMLKAPGHTLADGGAGNDTIYGGPGADTLVGGAGRDVISAGPGNDKINVKDGERDRVNCGSGRDSVRADRADVLTGCEVVSPKPKRKG